MKVETLKQSELKNEIKILKQSELKNIIINTVNVNDIDLLQQKHDENTVNKKITIKILDEFYNINDIVSFVKSDLNSEYCESFGSSYNKMKDLKFWLDYRNKYACYVVYLDEIIIGIICFQGTCNVGDDYVPSGYGFKGKRKPISYHNLADIIWIKSSLYEDVIQTKGVMQHAIAHIINQIISPNNNNNSIQGIIAVIKTDSDPLHCKSRQLALNLGLSLVSDEFHGSYMGSMRSYIALKK